MFSSETARTLGARHAIHGPVIGIVTQNKDTEGEYRVMVMFPDLREPDQGTSYWARIATLGAGPKRGWYTLPNVDDEVLCVFERGNPQSPIIIGSLWNGKSKAFRHNKDGNNFIAEYRSERGHSIKFNNDPDNPEISIVTSRGHTVRLSDKDDTCNIATSDGAHMIILDQPGKKISIVSEGDILIQAAEDVTIKAKTIHTESSDVTSMQAKNLETHADANTKLTSGNSLETKSTGVTKMVGALIQLNP